MKMSSMTEQCNEKMRIECIHTNFPSEIHELYDLKKTHAMWYDGKDHHSLTTPFYLYLSCAVLTAGGAVWSQVLQFSL